MNLIAGMHVEMNHCRKILKIYKTIPIDVFGVCMIREVIKKGEQVISSGGVIEMLDIYNNLKMIK